MRKFLENYMEETKSQNNLFWNVIQSKDREIAELKMVLSEYKLRAVKAEKLLEERSDGKKLMRLIEWDSLENLYLGLKATRTMHHKSSDFQN